jgi:hypothetical protein
VVAIDIGRLGDDIRAERDVVGTVPIEEGNGTGGLTIVFWGGGCRGNRVWSAITGDIYGSFLVGDIPKEGPSDEVDGVANDSTDDDKVGEVFRVPAFVECNPSENEMSEASSS